jgi:hypothetical protein
METVIIADVAGRELRAGDLLAARFRARGMHAWVALPSTDSVARCPVMDVSLGGARIAVGLAVEARLRVGERISIMVHLEGRPEWFLPIQAKVMRVGGGQTAVLQSVAAEVATEKRVRTLVINWWSFASDETKAVFGEDGGHAGLNETAFIQAIDRTLVHQERYKDDLATPYPAAGTWSAVPFPSSIGLYQKGQGYPKFDQAKADEYYKKVTDKVAQLIVDTKKKWDLAGL